MLGRNKSAKRQFDVPGTTLRGPFKIWTPDSHQKEPDASLKSNPRTTRLSGSVSDAPRASALFKVKVTKSVEGKEPFESKSKRSSIRYTTSETGHGSRSGYHSEHIPPVPPLPTGQSFSNNNNVTAPLRNGIPVYADTHSPVLDDRTPTSSASSSRQSSSEFLHSTDAHRDATGGFRNGAHYNYLPPTAGYHSFKAASTGHNPDFTTKSSFKTKFTSIGSRVPPGNDPYNTSHLPSSSQQQTRATPRGTGITRKQVNAEMPASHPSLQPNSKAPGSTKHPPTRKLPQPPLSVDRQVKSDDEWNFVSPPTSVYVTPSPSPAPSQQRSGETTGRIGAPDESRQRTGRSSGWLGSLGRKYATDTERPQKVRGHKLYSSLDSPIAVENRKATTQAKTPSPSVSSKQYPSPSSSRQSEDHAHSPVNPASEAENENMAGTKPKEPAKKLSDEGGSKIGRGSDDSHNVSLPSPMRASESSPVVSGLRNFFTRGKITEDSVSKTPSPRVSDDSLQTKPSTTDVSSSAASKPHHERSQSSPWSFNRFTYRMQSTVPGPTNSSVETLSRPSGGRNFLFKTSASKRKKTPPDTPAPLPSSATKESVSRPNTPAKDSIAKSATGRNSPSAEPSTSIVTQNPALPNQPIGNGTTNSLPNRRRPPPPPPRDQLPPNSPPATTPPSQLGPQLHAEIEDSNEKEMTPQLEDASSTPTEVSPTRSVVYPAVENLINTSSQAPQVNPSYLSPTVPPVSAQQLAPAATPSPMSTSLTHRINVDSHIPDSQTTTISAQPNRSTAVPNLSSSNSTTRTPTSHTMSSSMPYPTAPNVSLVSPVPRPASSASIKHSTMPHRPSLLRSTSTVSVPEKTNDLSDNSDQDKDPLATPESLASPSPTPPPLPPPSLDYRRHASFFDYLLRPPAPTPNNPHEIWLPPSIQLNSIDRENIAPSHEDSLAQHLAPTRTAIRPFTSTRSNARPPIDSWMESSSRRTSMLKGAASQAKPRFPFRLTSEAQNRSVSAASMEAVVGLELSSHPPTPSSIHLDMPVPPSPPTRDPAIGVEEWRKKEEEEIYSTGRKRRRRPGVTFDF